MGTTPILAMRWRMSATPSNTSPRSAVIRTPSAGSRFREPPDRRRRLAVFAEAYGLQGVDGLVDVVIQRQRLTIRHVQELADLGMEPQRRWIREGFLDELVRRVEWSSIHRHLLE